MSSIGEGAIIGGLSAVHQYVRIGTYAFVGGMTGITADVIPFGMAIGNRADLCGLNIVGLKRKGFPREQIHELRQAYRMLFASEGTLMERLEDVEPHIRQQSPREADHRLHQDPIGALVLRTQQCRHAEPMTASRRSSMPATRSKDRSELSPGVASFPA